MEKDREKIVHNMFFSFGHVGNLEAFNLCIRYDTIVFIGLS